MGERFRIATVRGQEYPFQLNVPKETIRIFLAQQLNVAKREIFFKPGTYPGNSLR